MRGSSVATLMRQAIFRLSFRERTRTRFKWSERDEADLEQMRRTTTEVVVVLEEEEANRTLNEAIYRRKWVEDWSKGTIAEINTETLEEVLPEFESELRERRENQGL